jgi:hypothetical protein
MRTRTATVSKSLPAWALAVALVIISLVVILPR